MSSFLEDGNSWLKILVVSSVFKIPDSVSLSFSMIGLPLAKVLLCCPLRNLGMHTMVSDGTSGSGGSQGSGSEHIESCELVLHSNSAWSLALV